MKKLIVFLMTTVMILSLVGCGHVSHTNVDEPNSDVIDSQYKTYFFDAKILSVSADSILVEPVESSIARNSSDKISISTTGVACGFELIKGQMITVYYDGLIAESYPAQIYGAKKFELLVDEISMNAENVSATGATLIFDVDASFAAVISGQYYSLEFLGKDYCKSIEFVTKDDVAWTLEAIPISDGRSLDINWEWLYGTLEPGTYRIGKQISAMTDTASVVNTTIYAEFEIK